MPLTPREVLDEVRAGRRVILVTPSHSTGRDLFADVVDAVTPEDGVTVRAANGNERISHPSGGWALFGPIGRGRWRGYSADTLDFRNPPTLAERGELVPCVLASSAPRILGGDT